MLLSVWSVKCGQWVQDSCKVSKVCHRSLVGLDPSIVSQIGQLESPFVGFVFVLHKSFVRHR